MKTNIYNYKIRFFVVALITLLLLLITIFLIYSNKFANDKKNTNTDLTDTTASINYSPPNEEEVNAGNNQKEQLPPADQEPEKPYNANVVIVDVNQNKQDIEVRAFVSNVVKNGTCKIVFEKNDLKFSKIVNAFADASTTPCMSLIVPREEFPEPGEWKVTVIYESSELVGSTESLFEIK